ncbi:hypothetical protein [Petroclostridium sp. X23]|uniref:hypothetical protein n=1 Tax=Petroclostridium sp. X23 TaxID=3045146 RepID=UPI0024ADA1D0|nr:hypothetical protein [Petroclostridium sp. X23]WHH58764.1 hypothetical protein QKW49_23725 [Petroclostridium sp. X23]
MSNDKFLKPDIGQNQTEAISEPSLMQFGDDGTLLNDEELCEVIGGEGENEFEGKIVIAICCQCAWRTKRGYYETIRAAAQEHMIEKGHCKIRLMA